jgi:hypothetical protein
VLPVLDAEEPLLALQRGSTPRLAELRLHQGTVWRWNRAIYDPVEGGHLRIEMRALPAGPSLRDSVANAAFLVGLTLGLAARMDTYCCRLSFGHVRRNFYAAARQGLEAELLWPSTTTPSPRLQPAPRLIQSQLPLAHSGLVDGGVDAAEAEGWLAVVRDRAAVGQTGATWQLGEFERRRAGADDRSALHGMLLRYLELSEPDLPVHTWPNGAQHGS